jgi:hypothetical protein
MLTSRLLKRADANPDLVERIHRVLSTGDIHNLVKLAYQLESEKGMRGYAVTEEWEELARVHPESFETLKDMLTAQGEELGDLIEEDGNEGGDIPWLIAPSVIEELTPYPRGFFMTAPITVVLDAYFGICYQDQRDGHRFEKGSKKIMMQRIKGTYRRCSKLMALSSEPCLSGISCSGPEALIDIYGEKDVMSWWDTVDPQEWERSLMCGVADCFIEGMNDIQQAQHLPNNHAPGGALGNNGNNPPDIDQDGNEIDG